MQCFKITPPAFSRFINFKQKSLLEVDLEEVQTQHASKT
jgi:hypothetical protein